MQFIINECSQILLINNTFDCRNNILISIELQSSNCNINRFKAKSQILHKSVTSF